MSKIDIRAYEEKDSDIWDNFVDQSINGTIFHKRRFLNYHQADRFNDTSLMFFYKNKLAAVFPAASVKDNGGRIIKSHPGASYGGLVIKDNLGLEVIFNVFEELEKYAKVNGYTKIEFRLAPRIFNKEPCDQIDFTLVSKNYFRKEEELATCYFLPQYKNLDDEDILKNFHQKTRNEIRQGIKSGLSFSVIEDDNSTEQFHDILVENLKKHNTKPVHSLAEIRLLNKIFKEEIKLFSINYEGHIIGNFFVFKINAIGLHIFYSVLNYQYQNLRPLNFGLFKLIQYAAKRDFQYLNYGISTEEGGKKINWNLLKFKEGFNGSGTLRTYWQKNLED